jgi:hypothetical protein
MIEPTDREPGQDSPGDAGGASGGGGLSVPASVAWASISESLGAVSAKARRVLVVQRVGVLIAWTLGVAIALALLDYALRVPGWLRMLTLPAWLGLLGWAWWTWVRPALSFRPGTTEVALRVERAYPELKGRLGAASDLAQGRGTMHSETSRQMAETVVRSVANQWGGRDAGSLVRMQGLKRAGLGLAGAGAVAMGLFALSPSNWWIGAQRVLIPWGGAEWPKQTGVVDATAQGVHALGEALPLRAVLTRSDLGPEKTDVFVEYRFVGATAGGGGGWRKELLTWQSREASASVTTRDALGGEQTSEVSGPLFERLVDPSGDSVEYRILTADDETPTRTLRLVPPPALVSATVTITTPAYAKAVGAEGGGEVKADLGAGTDERASAPSALAGSRVALTLNLNKNATFEPGLLDQLRLLDGAIADGATLVPGPSGGAGPNGGGQWTLSWTLTQPLRLIVRPVDENGIAARDDAVLRFDALLDKPAEATITTPSSDRGVLATALVPVVAEGRDDVGLKWVSLERQIAKPAGRPQGEKSGPGGALEPVGVPEEVAREPAAAGSAGVASAGSRSLSVSTSVDLAVLGVRAGDEVRLTALAKDVFAIGDAPDSERAPTRSAVRTLRIISESQFIDEVQRELGQVRQAAIRVEAQQGELQSRTQERGADRQSRRGQAQVSERLSRQEESVQRVAERVKENGLMDPALGEVLRQAQQTLERAGQSSAEAGKTLDEASAGQPEPPAGDENAPPVGGEKAKAAAEDQQQVRDEMTKLAELLDRGQDNWVVKNKLDQLIKAQEQARERTKALGQQTAGKSAAELSAQQKGELDAIVEKQTQLAEEVAKLTKEMREKSKELSKKDASAGKGMQDAADRAEQQQVSEGMKSAASSASQNRMSDAQKRQEQAAKALKQMKEDLDDDEKRQAMMLKLKLQEIAQAIERLIKEQEKQIGALEAAQRAQGGYDGLDKGMIALNQNTLGVGDQARAVKGLEPVVKLLGKASDSQADAVKALRSPPVDPEPVRMLENESLDALKTALERAKEMGKKAAESEERQKLAELKQKYAEALKEQERLRAETSGFAGMKELSRRDKVLVRRLGEGQTAVGESLAALHDGTKELKEAAVFDYAHKRLAETSGGAAKALEQGEAATALRPQDASIATIKSVIEALTDPKNDSKFSQGAQSGGGGGGGGGGGQGLIPPARQLRLLRMIQSDIARATNEVNQGGADAVAGGAAEDIAKQQRDIATVGLELIKKMSSGTGGGGGGEIPFGPGNEPKDPAKPGDAPPAKPDEPGNQQAPEKKPEEVPSAA